MERGLFDMTHLPRQKKIRLNRKYEQMKPTSIQRTSDLLDDRLVRFIGIPFFGTVIPSATGLINFELLTAVQTIPHFMYFILLALVIWQGNRWLLIKYYPVFYNSDSTLQKYVLMIGLNILYTGPISAIMLFGWKFITGSNHVSDQILLITIIANVICVIFVTNIYEKVLFMAQRDHSKVETAKLEQAKTQAELDALKNQIDPHFMFNSLNGLSHLVEKDSEKAQLFIDHLSGIYRYILKSKDTNLVFVRDELSFIKAYADLMQIRYSTNFSIHITIDKAVMEHCLIPPVSLMVALENATKHNEISTKNPLLVTISSRDECIEISNPIVLRQQAFESNKVGLSNLNDRFKKTVKKGIDIHSDENVFTVTLPIIKVTSG